MIIFYILLLVRFKARQLVYSFDSNTQNLDYWVALNSLTSNFSFCQGRNILGGYGSFDMNSALMRYFQLTPHFRLYIELTFYRIDSWDSDGFKILLDHKQIYFRTFSYASGVNLCGDPYYNDEIIQIEIQAEHYSNFASLEMVVLDLNGDNNESWGMSIFNLYIEPCPNGCQYCQSNSPYCQEWSLQYQQQRITTYNYYNILLYQCYHCTTTCTYALALPQHQRVMISFYVLIWQNGDIYFDILIDNVIYESKHQSSSSVFYTFFEGALINMQHVESSINIKLQRTGGSYNWLYIKDFQVLIWKDEIKIQKQILGCSNLIEDSCWSCENGWVFDPFIQACLQKENDSKYENKNHISNLSFVNECQFGWIFNDIIAQCIPICGDYLIMGQEQCDDGNQIHYDGCFDCQFECILFCIDCQYGICLACQQGFQLINNQCKPICGDSLLIPYVEECDDGNNISYDGCNECKFKCTENCISCISDQCLRCGNGFILSLNECTPICGDSIVIPNYEECDDGNDELYDGCYRCKYQCNTNCNMCQDGRCIDQCQYGQMFINNKCQSICGNSIVTGVEQCDDGNNLQYDGCYQCQYSCPLNCYYCENGVCLECQVGYKLYKQQCQDIAICGDGYLGDEEQCDDGNSNSNDGCYKCNVENNWECNIEEPTLCFYNINPLMVLNYLNNTFQTQYVQIKFSMDVLIYSYPLSMQIQIINVKVENYNIIVYPILEAKQNLSNPEYEISIDIFEMLTKKPVLEVNINQQVVNQYQLELKNSKQQIELQIPQYLSPNQKQKAEKISKSNEQFIYGLGAISVLSFFMGDTAMFQEILLLVQYQSYLKYINLDYPLNLYIFFQSTNIVSVSPILKYTNLNYYLNKYSLKQGPLKSHGKFALYKYDADLITNLSCQIIQFIGLSLAFIIKLVQKLLYRKTAVTKYVDCMKNLKNKFSDKTVFTLNNFLYSSIKALLNSSKIFAKQGLHVLFTVNSQDLIFKAFLYFNSTQLNSIRDYVQVCISLTIVTSYVGIIFYTFSKKNLLSTEQGKLQSQINLITITRSIIFLGLLVFWQSNQIQQTILISLTNIMYLIVLKQLKRVFIYSNFIQQIVEGSVILFTLSSFVYFNDLKTYFTEETQIILGWCHISLLLFTLLAEASKYFVAKGKALFDQIRKKLQEIKQEKERRANPIFI